MESYESNRGQIIVTADDFGLNEQTNRNILYLISLGKINRVAVMVHGKISPNEVEELIKSHVKLDVHLDILHEFDESKKRRSGSFGRVLDFCLKLAARKITIKKVTADWENQIEMFRKIFGKNPDGLNSHEHVHLFPPFFKVALDLREKYTIPYIRFGDSISMPHHNMISYILHLLRRINLPACTSRSCVSSGSLVSIDWIKNVDNFLTKLPDGTTEVACHPELDEDFVKIKEYF